MKRIEKILLCGQAPDSTKFLYISDDEKAYIYKAWNDKKNKDVVKIPNKIRDKETGKMLAVELVGWNSIDEKYEIINKNNIEMMINEELT